MKKSKRHINVSRMKEFKILVGIILISCACNKQPLSITPENLYSPAPSPSEITIITNGVIIDGSGQAPMCNKSIVIQGERITNIIDSYKLDEYPEANIIDLQQAFILPGFINSHVHTELNASNLKAWARDGVTTVRDCAYYGPTIPYFAGRDELNKDFLNARLVSAGPLLTTSGGYGMLGLASAQEARSEVTRLLNEGGNFIKIAIEDNLQGRTWPLLSAEKITSITQTAHERNKWVCAHLSRAKHVRIAIDNNVNELSHMIVNNLPDDMIRELVQKDIYWNPTLELWNGTDQLYNANWLSIAKNNLGRFVKAGGKVALGTDFGGYITPFDLGMPITELKLMGQAGMTPMQIIVAATKNGSKVCGMENEIGTIEPGKVADILVVYDNPLDDLNSLTDPRMVIHNGSVILDNGPQQNTSNKKPYCPPAHSPISDDR